MKIQPIKQATPVKKTLAVVKKAAKKIETRTSNYLGRDIEPAIANLERRAENLTPEEYISARKYLANAEMNYRYASEMSDF